MPVLEHRQDAGIIVGPAGEARPAAQRPPEMGVLGAGDPQGHQGLVVARHRDPDRPADVAALLLARRRIVEGGGVPAVALGGGGEHRLEVEIAVGDVDQQQPVRLQRAANCIFGTDNPSNSSLVGALTVNVLSSARTSISKDMVVRIHE